MGRSRDINEKMKRERRERILSGALELFALNGLAGTKISDIASHTRMSNGLIYHYFPSKEEIFTELIRISFERLVEACRLLENMPLKPHLKIMYAIDELVKTFKSKRETGLYHLIIAQATASKNIPAKAKEIIHNNRKIPYETIARIISQGQVSGTVNQGNPKDLAFFFWININGIAMHHVMYRENAQTPDLTHLYRMFSKEGKTSV